MQISELRELSDQELESKEVELSENMVLLKLRHRTHQLDSPALLRKTRRDLARTKTLRHQRAAGR